MTEESNFKFDDINFTNIFLNINPLAAESTPQGIGNDIIDVDTVIYP